MTLIQWKKDYKYMNKISKIEINKIKINKNMFFMKALKLDLGIAEQN
jgi:hypothetical protein